MNADTIRLGATYAIALLTLVGCFLLMFFPSRVTQDALMPTVTAIVGVVLGFVFNKESTTSGARSAERSVSIGAATSGTGTVVNSGTTTVGPQDSVTVSSG